MQNDKLTKDIILFDLDGTLTDPKSVMTKSISYALEAFGIHVENLDELCKFIGPPMMDSFKNFYGFDEADALKAVEKYREYYREYYRETGICDNELFSGMDDLLQGLAEECKMLIVATSKPKVFADIILEHFHIAKYFSFVCGSELDGTRTKKGEVIQYALEKAGVRELSKVVMVGDREYDVIGAKEAGIDCIGVLYGYGSYDELNNAGASLIVETVADLSKALL